MKLFKKRGIVFFWFVMLADCFLVLSEQESYRVFTKLLIIPILFAFLYTNANKKHYSQTKLIVYSALFVSWIGDILIVINPDNTIASAIALIVSCSIYCFAFIKIQRVSIGTESSQKSLAALIVYIAICIGLFRWVGLYMENYKALVILFMLIMACFVFLAANVLNHKIKRSLAINFFLPSAALFVAYFFFYALHKFLLKEEDFFNVVIALTYGYGQSLMVLGFKKILK